MSEWVSEWVSEWERECVRERQRESDWLIDWLIEWVSGREEGWSGELTQFVGIWQYRLTQFAHLLTHHPTSPSTNSIPYFLTHSFSPLVPLPLIPIPPHPSPLLPRPSSLSSFPSLPSPPPSSFDYLTGCPTLSCRKRLLQDFVSLSSLLTNNYAIVLGSFKYYFNFQNFIEDAVFEPMAIPGVHSSFHYFIILCQKLDRCLFVSTLLRQLLIKTEEWTLPVNWPKQI